MATLDLVEAFVNVHRDTKKYPQPFSLPRPWPVVEEVTAEERAEAERYLADHSAFAE